MKTAYREIQTNAPLDQVVAATVNALGQLGGAITVNGNVITIVNGTLGVNLAWLANISAQVVVNQTSPDQYEVVCTINHNPNGLVWVMTILGIFMLWFLWIFTILYLFMNPEPRYQQVLNSIAV